MTTKALEKEQSVDMFQHRELLKELTDISKVEKDKIEHEIVLAKTRLKEIKEECLRREGEFNQRIRSEDQMFKNTMSKRHNEMIDQQNKIDILYRDVLQRQKDLIVHEEKLMKEKEETKKLNEQRIDIEKMRVAAHQLMAEADNRISHAKNLMGEANTRMEHAVKLDKQNTQRNIDLCNREDKMKVEMNNLATEKEYLQKLKDYVEPKIEEIKQIESRIAADKKEIEDKYQSVVIRSEENKIHAKALQDKEAKLDKLEKELKAKRG